jgi:hypothetical protein
MEDGAHGPWLDTEREMLASVGGMRDMSQVMRLAVRKVAVAEARAPTQQRSASLGTKPAPNTVTRDAPGDKTVGCAELTRIASSKRSASIAEM